MIQDCRTIRNKHIILALDSLHFFVLFRSVLFLFTKRSFPLQEVLLNSTIKAENVQTHPYKSLISEINCRWIIWEGKEQRAWKRRRDKKQSACASNTLLPKERAAPSSTALWNVIWRCGSCCSVMTQWSFCPLAFTSQQSRDTPYHQPLCAAQVGGEEYATPSELNYCPIYLEKVVNISVVQTKMNGRVNKKDNGALHGGVWV